MKQRFVNQKLGKRASRKGELQKAKTFTSQASRPRRTNQVPQAPAPPEKAR